MAETRIFSIRKAALGLVQTGLVIGFILLVVGVYTIEQEPPASDAGVIQGVIFGLMAFAVLGFLTLVINCLVCFSLRACGKLFNRNFAISQVGVCALIATPIYIFLSGRDIGFPNQDLYVAIMLCIVIFSYLFAAIMFWWSGCPKK